MSGSFLTGRPAKRFRRQKEGRGGFYQTSQHQRSYLCQAGFHCSESFFFEAAHSLR